MKQGKHIDYEGTIRYYKDDKLHRDDDLPAVIWGDGRKVWYQNGKKHRDNDLPSVERDNGGKIWFKNGLRHRLSGPAWIYGCGEEAYHINGIKLTKEQHANHPLVKKYKLQQILNRVLNEPDIKTMHTQEEQT